ncbi:MAG: hypothetical protein U0133_19835 [Gemmatimonadales bacterium]
MRVTGRAVLLGLGLFGCAPSQMPTPEIVDVTAAEYAFGAPDTIAAGTVTFRMKDLGQEGHVASIVRLGEGASIATLMQSGYVLEYVHIPDALGGPVSSPGDSASDVTLTLAPGRYAFFCYFHSPDGTTHASKGMVREFRVVERGKTSEAAARADTILLGDFSVQSAPALPAGERRFYIRNDGKVGHEVGIYRLAEGWTLAEAKAWEDTVSTESMGPWQDYGGVGLLAPGAGIVLRGTFPPGEYRIDCGITDPKLKKSHAEMGMVTALTLRSN